MGSIFLYLLIFIISSLSYWAYCKNNKKIFLIVAFLLPFLLGSLRYYVGTDYKNYVLMYKYNSDVGLLFNIIAKFSRKMGSYVWIFVIYQFLTLLFLHMGLKNIKKEIRPFVYFCYLFTSYVGSYNAVRQALAISIVFYAYQFLINKDAKKWIIFIIFATLCHTTAIICLPLYLFFQNRNEKTRILSLVLMCILVSYYGNILEFLSGFSLFSHYSIYINERLEIANNKSFYIDILMLFYILLYQKQLTKYNEDNKIYIYLYIICIILSTVGFINPYVKRISGYYSLPRIILLSNIPLVCRKSKDKLLNYVLISLSMIILFIANYYILGHSEVIPYRTIIGEKIS